MSRLTTYAYDLSGNIVEKGLANGTKEVRTHDGLNRVSTLDNRASGGGNVAGYAYGYDRAGNVMEVEETYPSGELSNRTIINSYDGVYRLLTEAITTGGSTVTSTYVYDKGHNRTSQAVSGGATTTYVIGNGSNGAGANQIVSATTGGVTTAYAYDANGNRTSRTIGSASDIYSYDDDNRLINLNYQTGTSGLGTYAYGYDYRTRRVARTEPGPVRTNIVFDGGTSIIEYGAGGAASPNVEYIRDHDYGGGVGGLEYSVRSGAASFNFYDSRGDVTTQTSVTGTVTYQAAYEAFGDQTATSGSMLDRQKANTKEEDPTGLLNEGFRYRDPSTGTFLTRDPLGFKAGPNMYCYVHQNPWTHFDPEGLEVTVTDVKTVDKKTGKTKTETDIKITGKFIDKSSARRTEEEKKKLVERITKDIDKDFSGSKGDHTWKMDIKLTVVDNEKDVKKGDTLYKIVDDIKANPKAKGGLGITLPVVGGHEVDIISDIVKITPGTKGKGNISLDRTVSHETGHVLGERHGDDAKNPLKLDKSNLMNQTRLTSSRTVTENQINQIKKDYDAGKLNK